MNGKQSKTVTQNYSNYSWYSKKKKDKGDMERSCFLGSKRTRVWPKKLLPVKRIYFNEKTSSVHPGT